MCPGAPYLVILLCLTPDNFTCQGKTQGCRLSVTDIYFTPINILFLVHGLHGTSNVSCNKILCFLLCFADVFQHIKFTLFNSTGYPLVNTRALVNEEFKVASELMASSIAQEGPAPCLLSENVFAYVARGICSVQSYNWLEHVEDEQIKNEIYKVHYIRYVKYQLFIRITL